MAPDAGLAFAGNVEPKEVFAGAVDVVVTDGFTGNILIKTAEAAGEWLRREIRSAVRRRPDTVVGGLLVRPALKRVQRALDYRQYGGAPLLGLTATVIIAHGRSDAVAIRNAIRAGRDAARGRAANVSAAVE
jgi:glycerol-3-phosphate acyltransferase PlsX